ncbi:Uncharacterised protein [BD1-7 clade bacterium]|uniref:DNA-binding protein n=1 Tax=BD1-7 clade bacterium TaxID=2029982 RepID=A0A5S9N2G6_9GAMM|nr:Uncharacterised protein [BD1-7 clade bacterium]CAA0083414.1 Uncharacterised protein [BD1-7 clade bacterium]
MKRRFIAGAICPKCEQLDKIVMYDDDNHKRHRECVSCGFKELMLDQPDADEISTRVNQPRAGEKPLSHEDEVQVVQLMDPKKLH